MKRISELSILNGRNLLSLGLGLTMLYGLSGLPDYKKEVELQNKKQNFEIYKKNIGEKICSSYLYNKDHDDFNIKIEKFGLNNEFIKCYNEFKIGRETSHIRYNSKENALDLINLDLDRKTGVNKLPKYFNYDYSVNFSKNLNLTDKLILEKTSSLFDEEFKF